MSVVAQSTRGWVLDARSLIDEGYSACTRRKGETNINLTCCFKKRCFQMSKSYYRETVSAAAEGGDTELLQKDDKPTKKRKRKRSELNQGEIDSQAFHEKIRSVVLEGTKCLVDSARSLGYLKGGTATLTEEKKKKEEEEKKKEEEKEKKG
ncbi:uncharacterized protein LOC128382169, partial [Scomber japonicus]|uniref:uncharacterized protein LOC128382169 n=1 Tax=Scomber japonicus TaxID=13676 RepID=UPI00230566F4